MLNYFYSDFNDHSQINKDILASFITFVKFNIFIFKLKNMKKFLC